MLRPVESVWKAMGVPLLSVSWTADGVCSLPFVLWWREALAVVSRGATWLVRSADKAGTGITRISPKARQAVVQSRSMQSKKLLKTETMSLISCKIKQICTSNPLLSI